MKVWVNTPDSFKRVQCKEKYVLFFGDKIGNELYANYVKNTSNALKAGYASGRRKAAFAHFFPEYYIDKGFSEAEAIEKVKERKEKAIIRSKQAIADGRRISNTQLEYYLRLGMTETEAEIALAKRQDTCSLKSFQKRYGDEEGLKRFNARNAKWQTALNNKSDDEKRRIYDARVAGFTKAQNNFVSKAETKIFDLIEKALDIKIERQHIIQYKKKNYIFDGFLKNILLEFNGDYWHCNPLKYSVTFYHTIRKQYAKDIWAYDKFKCDEVGKEYKKFIIWENELNDTDRIIERFRLCLSGS